MGGGGVYSSVGGNTLSNPFSPMCPGPPPTYKNFQLRELRAQSPKFKRVSDKTPEFPFWGLIICVDFDLRYSKEMENINKLNKMVFHNKNIDIHKTA